MTQSMTLKLTPGTTIVEFDSNSQSKIYRVELADGRHFQVNETLFLLLDQFRRPLALPVLKESFSEWMGNTIKADEVESISKQLLSQGILVEEGVMQVPPAQRQENASLLALHFRRDLFSAETLAPIVRPFQAFFTRPVAVVLGLLIAAVHLLAYTKLGIPPQVDMTTVNWPLFYVVILATILIHELGHLAACQRWHCPHGPLGFGFYFFNPVFYVDVTAAWRLTRWQRAVVDIAGIYLQLVATILFWLLWGFTHDATWLFAIVASDFFALMNLGPFMKLDGYWLLSDLTGVPNLHTRVADILGYFVAKALHLVGLRPATSTVSPFMQWSKSIRWTIGIYVVLSLLVWPLSIVGMVPMLTQLVLTYPELLRSTVVALPATLAQGDFVVLFRQLSSLFLPTLMLANLVMLALPLLKRLRQNRKG